MFQRKKIFLNSDNTMPHTFFFNMNLAMLDFRNYVQYEHAFCRVTHTKLIANTDLVSQHCNKFMLNMKIFGNVESYTGYYN